MAQSAGASPSGAGARMQIVASLVIIAVGVAATWGAILLVQRADGEREEREYQKSVSDVADALVAGSAIGESLATGVGFMFNQDSTVSDGEFGWAVNQQIIDHPLGPVAWIEADPSSDVLTITHARPNDPGNSPVGTELAPAGDLATAVRAAGDTGSVQLVAGSGLAGEEAPTTMLVVHPVFRVGAFTDTPAQREAAFLGASVVGLDVPAFIRQVQAADAGSIDFVLRTGGDPGGEFVWVGGELADSGSAVQLPDSLQGEPRMTEPLGLGLPDAELEAYGSGPPSNESAENVALVLGVIATVFAVGLYARTNKGLRLRNMAEALEEANAQLEASADELRVVVGRDRLTGLPNRREIHRRVGSSVARAGSEGGPVSFGLVNLDGFKTVNDSLGQGQGDELLREVGARIAAAANQGSSVGRVSGDEFGLLMPGYNSHQAAVEVDRVLGALTRSFVLGERVVHLTASAGTCSFPEDADDVEQLLKNADLALHAAKEGPGGRRMAYDAGLAERSARRDWLERELRKALDNPGSELRMFFQPKIDLGSGEIVAAEALARWDHPTEGAISPGEFIPVAEQTGLIVRLGELSVRQACGLVRACVDRGLPPMSISVNMSDQQLDSPGLVHLLRSEVDRAEVPASSIIFEVTETAVMADVDRDGHALARLRALCDMGVRLSIDDFGTGFSSMSRLAELPLHELKIDRAFVSGLPDAPAQAGITRAIISMAHSLGLSVVAEGVETTDQLSWLRTEGCDVAQGYLFSRAVPFEEFVEISTPDANEVRASSSRDDRSGKVAYN